MINVSQNNFIKPTSIFCLKYFLLQLKIINEPTYQSAVFDSVLSKQFKRIAVNSKNILHALLQWRLGDDFKKKIKV